MAHWNEIREQARLWKIPNSEDVIRKYEETGDDTHWYEFIELMRADELRKRKLRAKPPSNE